MAAISDAEYAEAEEPEVSRPSMPPEMASKRPTLV
jgi:hypothetical protein